MILDGEMRLSSNFEGDMNLVNEFDGQFGQVLAPSGDKHRTYEQAHPSDTWLVIHNLRKHPSVTIVDTAYTVIVGDVEYIDENRVKITFNTPTAGYAYFN